MLQQFISLGQKIINQHPEPFLQIQSLIETNQNKKKKIKTHDRAVGTCQLLLIKLIFTSRCIHRMSFVN